MAASVPLRIGVLALQGCVQPHQFHIESLGATFVEIKRPEELKSVQGLILPGGESSTMIKLIDVFSLESSLKAAFQQMPVWGICAGSILMAKSVQSPAQKSFGLIDMTVERNSYGRQQESFSSTVNGYTVSFIRAPRIVSVGKEVKIIAEKNGDPIWIQSGSYMATTFHAELTPTAPSPMHEAFLKLIRG